MDKKIILHDNNGKEFIGDIITELLIDDNRYIVYSIEKDMDYCDLYVSRIVQDNDGNDIVINVDDDIEKEKVFDIVNKMIDNFLKKSHFNLK